MRSSKSIVESSAQKHMANSGFGCRFYNLRYFEFGLFFKFFEFNINFEITHHGNLCTELPIVQVRALRIHNNIMPRLTKIWMSGG